MFPDDIGKLDKEEKPTGKNKRRKKSVNELRKT